MQACACLEDNNGRDHVLSLAERESDGAVTVRQVVDSDGLGRLIRANTADLGAKIGVKVAPFGEGGPADAHHIVAAVNNEQADQLLKPIHHKVSTHVLCILVPLHQLPWTGIVQIAAVRLHPHTSTRQTHKRQEQLFTPLPHQQGEKNEQLTRTMMGSNPTDLVSAWVGPWSTR